MRSSRPRNWPAGECREPVDGGCIVSDRLRIGESSGARLAGQLGSDERERPLGEIVGQLGRNAGGLDKVPPVREQIRDAPLQPPGAGGNARRRRLASLQNPWAGGGGLQRRGGSTVSPGRIGAEATGPSFGHRALLEHRHEHEVHPDEMIDEVTAKLAELQENLKLIDHKINVYRGRLAAGDADQLWAPNHPAGAR